MHHMRHLNFIKFIRLLSVVILCWLACFQAGPAELSTRTLRANAGTHNVTWANVVNATVTENSIQKTSGRDDTPDAGATSQQSIQSGSGYVECIASETNKYRWFGLSNGNSDSSSEDIDFALNLTSYAFNGGFVVNVHENGEYKTDTVYRSGDSLRVAVEAGIVKYYKNGTAFYTSSKSPTYPLLVDTSFRELGGTLTNVVVSFDGVNASVTGQWSAPMSWPLVAIHTHVLPNGKVLTWSNDIDAQDRSSVDSSDARLWDPETGAFTLVPNLTTNLFCSGHSFLPDGRLLVTGGHYLNSFIGEPDSNIFDFKTNRWSRGPDMNRGRWYPTNCTLGSGEVLVVSGTDERAQLNTLPQVWQSNGEWRSLTSALAPFLPLYPWLHVAPNGKVFNSGPDESTRFLDAAGTGSWAAGPESNYGFRDAGTSVMYDEGKVLIVGGGAPTNTAEVIDLNQQSPSWRQVASMAFARRHLNATILPDGKVLVTGGTSGGGHNSANGSVLAAEMWNPETEAWETMASMQVRRLYHSTAVLLPDGRVLSAGGGLPSAPEGDTDHFDAEIYSPPYLFKGTRPTITSAPETITYNQKFLIKTPDKKNISDVTWVRLSSVTHTINMDQRFARLSFARKGDGLKIMAPSNPNASPPGYYMLFIINGSGVPSVAKIIKIG